MQKVSLLTLTTSGWGILLARCSHHGKKFAGNGNKKYTNAKSVTVKKAKVSLKKGKTYKIKGKGTCTIFVYAHNGVSKKVRVTVK